MKNYPFTCGIIRVFSDPYVWTRISGNISKCWSTDCLHCFKKKKQNTKLLPGRFWGGLSSQSKAYLAAENRYYCCCSCSKVTPAPGFMPPPPIRCARPEAKTKSRKVLQCWQPGPAQYNLKSTLEGVDVKGRGWIKPEKKEDKNPKDKKDRVDDVDADGKFRLLNCWTSSQQPWQ